MNSKKGEKNMDYYVTQWIITRSAKVIVAQLCKKFRAVYGTRSFLTMSTSVSHYSLYWRIKMLYSFLKINFNIILH